MRAEERDKKRDERKKKQGKERWRDDKKEKREGRKKGSECIIASGPVGCVNPYCQIIG